MFFFVFFCVHKKNSVHTKKQCTQKKQNKQNKTMCSFSPHPIISFAISLLETSNMAQIIVPQLPMSLIQALSGGVGSISPLSFFPLVVDSRGGHRCCRRHRGMGGNDDATVNEVQSAGAGGTRRQTMTSTDLSGRGRMVVGRIPPHNDDDDILTSRAVVLCGGPVAATSFRAS